jgi:signal transduction histidine kinase
MDMAESEINMLKKKIALLTDLNATKDNFFSIIAHDLKSPFSSIMGFSDLIIEKVQMKDYSEIETFARYIQSSSSHVMELLTNLLEWSRTQTGKMAFNPENIKIGIIVNEVINLLNESAMKKSISIKTQISESCVVFADRAMLNTIMRNLISNSIKFTYPNGKITVSAYSDDVESVITVADNGIGIRKEDIEKLFRIEEFLSSKGTAGEEGTGLGLFICNEFVKKHGGEICVRSERGTGSEFIIKLPVQQSTINS